MGIVIVVALIALGYLSGSISSAIIITHLVTGEDIRTLGNENAGTANVGRSIGKGYAAIVFFTDVAKAVLPMLIARIALHNGEAYDHFIVVFVGIAAVLGHCKPVYFRFRGGSGIATTFGAIAFVTPIELILAMVSGFLLVRLLVRSSEYRLGRWTSGVILLLIPVVVTLSALVFYVPISQHYQFGGHAWYVVTGVWLTVGFAVAMNARLFGSYFRNLFTGAAGT